MHRTGTSSAVKNLLCMCEALNLILSTKNCICACIYIHAHNFIYITTKEYEENN